MEHSHDIGVLNTLIATTLDSVKGYSKAAEDSQGLHTGLFREMAQERSRIASDLQETVRTLGGDPEDDSSTMGAIHRGFINIKEAFTGNDEAAIVNEVERGEDYLKAKYEAALKDTDMSQPTRTAVEQAFVSVRKGHDRASALKNSVN
jgi:uncharacterized protein (TIGR02284 family)